MISIVIPMYRDGARAAALVDAMLQQALPEGEALEVIVVDDGSGDGSAELLQAHSDPRVQLIALPHNMGRSAARNAGASHGKGELLVFIDCDCRPLDGHFLAAHLHAIQPDHIASLGPVTGTGSGFWSRYQDEASARRATLHARGATFAGSSQNFMVRTTAYVATGGFDTRYREYGFEDRDLFIRLARAGSVVWCRQAVVRHLDLLTLTQVVAKMQLAAGQSALIFSNDHPLAYKALGYAAIDARLHHWLPPVCWLLRPLLQLSQTLDRLMERKQMPFFLGRFLVRIFSAIAYACGTVAQKRNKSSGAVPGS